MIITTFLNFIFQAILILLFPILSAPNASISSQILDSIYTVNQWYKNLNQFIPIDTLLTIFSILLTIELLIATYKVIMWTLKRFPTQS